MQLLHWFLDLVWGQGKWVSSIYLLLICLFGHISISYIATLSKIMRLWMQSLWICTCLSTPICLIVTLSMPRWILPWFIICVTICGVVCNQDPDFGNSCSLLILPVWLFLIEFSCSIFWSMFCAACRYLFLATCFLLQMVSEPLSFWSQSGYWLGLLWVDTWSHLFFMVCDL